MTIVPDTRHSMLFFGDQWDSMWRRRQQLAWRLSQSDLTKHVVYVERPLPITALLKFLLDRADRDASERWQRLLANRSWVMTMGRKLSVLTTFAPLPPVGPAPFFQASERARDHWLLGRLRRGFDVKRPVVWVSHPQISVDLIKSLTPGLLCYDCTEDFAAVPGLWDCARTQIGATDRWLTTHAHVVTAVSRTLYDEKRKVNSNTHLLPNAVDSELFLQPPDHFRMPAELLGVSRPVLSFVGGLNHWAHDWTLLDRVATLRSGWTFLLVGELSVSRETHLMLQSHPNLLCVGQKRYEELPGYLAHSDVCFQFYQQDRANDTRNSQKLFLYLAAGKPVVSTPSADVQAYVDFVSIVRSADEFVKAVEKALLVNDDSRAKKRQGFAHENSWAARAAQIEELLQRAV